MRISENIRRLQQSRLQGLAPAVGRLQELAEFRSDPGNLRALFHVPASAAEPMPLVVVLHGCTQSASAYDHHSGWSTLADRLGFMVLFPEQRTSNNPNRCFNWFLAEDTRRGQGEAASIHQMIEHLASSYPVDRRQIFCTGLSAGGAMTSVMLATYPDVFAGGAIIAGLPYSGAANVNEAFGFMHGRMRLSAQALAGNIRAASSHTGPWPRVSVWHGTADTTVASSNGDDVVKQWVAVQGLRAAPSATDAVEGYPHRVWRNKAGQPVVEQYVLAGMGHGTPLSPGSEEGQCGVAGPFMLNAGISSTDRIASFFGLDQQPGVRVLQREPEARRPSQAEIRYAPVPVAGTKSGGVQEVIENALRAAGLMR